MKKIISLLLVVMFAFAGCTRMVIIDENEKAAKDEWGLTLSAENVTPSGMTIVFNQMNGKQTGELQTGDWYALYTEENGEWKELPFIVADDVNVAWNSVAYMIPKGGQVSFEVNWEWLYGKLPTGKYRIDKEVMDFREAGDFDKKIYSLEFEICEKAMRSEVAEETESGEKTEKAEFTEITGDTEITLWFPNHQIDELEKETRKINVEKGLEESVLTEVFKGPVSENLISSVSGNVEILSVKTENGICTVDLSSEFREHNTGGSSREFMALMSIVNSLCEIEGIEKVKIKIDGVENPAFGGHFDMSEPFSPYIPQKYKETE